LIRSLPAKLGVSGSLFKGVAGGFFRAPGNTAANLPDAARHGVFSSIIARLSRSSRTPGGSARRPGFKAENILAGFVTISSRMRLFW